MIHSSGQGVAVTPLTGWYRQQFAWARRPLAEAGLIAVPLGAADPNGRIPLPGDVTSAHRDRESSCVLLSILGRLTMLHWSPRVVALVAVLALILIALGGLASRSSDLQPVLVSAQMTRRVLPPTRSLRSSSRSAPPASASRAPPRSRSRSRRTRPTTLLGLAALLSASTLADRFPVPVEGVDTGGVSLSFVFGVASIVLFGWAAGLLVVFLAPAITQLLEHRPPIRVAYNVSVARARRDRRGRGRRRRCDGDGASGVLARVGAAALGPVHGQPAPDHRRRRGQRAPLALRARAHERPRRRSSRSR